MEILYRTYRRCNRKVISVRKVPSNTLKPKPYLTQQCKNQIKLVALLNLSSWCLVMVERLFLAVPRGCLRFVIVVFPDHTHLLFKIKHRKWEKSSNIVKLKKITVHTKQREI